MIHVCYGMQCFALRFKKPPPHTEEIQTFYAKIFSKKHQDFHLSAL